MGSFTVILSNSIKIFRIDLIIFNFMSQKFRKKIFFSQNFLKVLKIYFNAILRYLGEIKNFYYIL